jgi:hypothetical protein
VTIGWGDGNESTNVTPTSNGNGTYTINGTHTYDDETAPGETQTLEITVLNKQNPSASPLTGSGTVTVNDAALVPTPLTLNGWTNTPTGQIAVGLFSDANPLATPSDFGAPTINWGDGSALTTGTPVPLPEFPVTLAA